MPNRMNINYPITIFIVTYNRADYLKECIESVLNQTYNNFSLCILDNASTDNTHNVVKSFNDNRINYIRHAKNIGGVANINYAIEICDAKYFVIFHDDDVMCKDMIEKEFNELEENEEYSIASSLCTCIDKKSKKIITNKKKNEDKISLFKGDEYLKNFLTGKPGLICPSVMYRNSFFIRMKLFFEIEVGPAADQYLWFEVEKLGGILCRINEPLMNYRLHESQDSKINGSIMEISLLKAIKKRIINDIKANKGNYHLQKWGFLFCNFGYFYFTINRMNNSNIAKETNNDRKTVRKIYKEV